MLKWFLRLLKNDTSDPGRSRRVAGGTKQAGSRGAAAGSSSRADAVSGIDELPSQAIVDGSPTWVHANKAGGKHDLELMKRCCHEELKSAAANGWAPAPFYFERVAILSRKAKNFAQEVEYCETYLAAVEKFYKKGRVRRDRGVAMGPTHAAIQSRLVKARQLLAAQRKND